MRARVPSIVVATGFAFLYSVTEDPRWVVWAGVNCVFALCFATDSNR